MGKDERLLELQSKWESLGISNDFLFGKVMQDAELCRELQQRIFPEMVIDHVEYPALQKAIDIDLDAKSVRLDVYVVDGEGTVYDMEMQMTDTRELPKRTRYYQAMMDLELIDKGKMYKELKKSFVIFICPFDLFQRGRHIYTFRNTCQEDKGILLGDDTTKVFLNTRGRKGMSARNWGCFWTMSRAEGRKWRIRLSKSWMRRLGGQKTTGHGGGNI